MEKFQKYKEKNLPNQENLKRIYDNTQFQQKNDHDFKTPEKKSTKINKSNEKSSSSHLSLESRSKSTDKKTVNQSQIEATNFIEKPIFYDTKCIDEERSSSFKKNYENRIAETYDEW